VKVPFDRGLAGHSDADVLTHAVIDAILGALAQGDIGRHFPDTDARYENVASLSLLRQVLDSFVKPAGWQVVNVDSTVLAEEPRLAPHVTSVRTSLAHALGIPSERVSVKAGTHEGLDAVGKHEAISAHAVALLMR
jgi:2-C-methyl-D-erythritol 2,4-cyclodiphosphate synthase